MTPAAIHAVRVLLLASGLLGGCAPRLVQPPEPVTVARIDDHEEPITPSLEQVAPASSVLDSAPPSPAASERLVSLDLRDADVRDVLRMLAEVGNRSILATDDVHGIITIRLLDTPWAQALAAVTSSLQLVWQADGDLIRVSTAERVEQEQERDLKRKRSSAELQPLATDYLYLSFAHAVRLAALIAGRGSESGSGVLSERGSVIGDPATNILLVTDTPESIARVRELVRRLDVAVPQIMIESSIVEASADLSRSLGVQWGYREGHGATAGGGRSVTVGGGDGLGGVPPMVDFPATVVPGAGSAFGMTIGSLTGARAFELRLTALAREGKARIISRPRVVTLNNMPATIKSLTVIRVKLPTSETIVNTGGGASAGTSAATERIETGIILVVTPQVAADGQVMLELFAKSSQADFSRAVDGIPTETSRETSAHVRVADGETVVLGGIYTDRRDDQDTGVPYLSDIPGFGWLFKRVDRDERREDLLVFLTPHVVGASIGEPVAHALQPNP